MEGSRRPKSHRDSSKRDKKFSSSSSNKEQSHSGGVSSKKHQTPRFGNLIPRNNDLKQFATKILGDYHSTVETLSLDHNQLMGVDRNLPITPLPSSLLPSSSSSNPFEQAFEAQIAKASSVFLAGGSHDEKPRPLPHPLSHSEGVVSRHSKKRKKGKTEPEVKREADPTEHAQFESLPKPGNRIEDEKQRKVKRSKREQHESSSDHTTLSSGHVTSSGSHVTVTGGHVTSEAPRKPNKLFIDTSSLDANDLQSIKDLIFLPPFITPINTPCQKLDNPFHFPPIQPTTASNANNTSNSSTATTTVLMDSQNSSITTPHSNTITRTSSYHSGAGSSVMTNDILGNISSSEDDSSSSSDDDDEESEGEAGVTGFSENTSSMLDKIRRELNPSTLNTLTPMKSSPPTSHHPLSLSAADESANLSPAKFSRSFLVPPTAPPTKVENASSESDSCSSDSDSDSDSESEPESQSRPIRSETRDSVLPSESLTQPFDPAHHSSFDHAHTQRQESRPFAYDPESVTNTPVTHGNQYLPSREQPLHFSDPTHLSHAHQSSRDERPSSQNSKKIRHSETGSRKRRQNGDQQQMQGGGRTDKKLQLSDIRDMSENRGNEGRAGYKSKPHPPGNERKEVTELLVQIPLSELPQKIKPQATVGPYHISSDSKRSGSVSDSSHLYRDNYHGDYRGWSNDYSTSSRSHDRGGAGERDHRHWTETPPPAHRPGDEYWSNYHENNSSNERHKHVNPQFYYDRAKALKREADSLPPCEAIRKALKYMEAVTYFMRHGHSQEIEMNGSGSGSRGGAYKIYSDIINMVKYCSKMGSDCKPLLILCLRCHSVLLWRMYMLKQYVVHQLYKELQDVFNTSSKLHQKSPVPSGNFSPLPSPTSVGSTASTCSVPSANEQSLAVTKSSCSKVMDYLTLTSHIHQSIDLWRQSDSMSSQHRDFFSNVNRKIGDITQFSSLTAVTDWIESGLQLLGRN